MMVFRGGAKSVVVHKKRAIVPRVSLEVPSPNGTIRCKALRELVIMKQICSVVVQNSSTGLEEKSRMSEFNLKSNVVDVTNEAVRICLR